LAIFDKYGVQHSQGSGGPDIIYVGAGIDCRNGRYAQGIQAMEDLLQRNMILLSAGVIAPFLGGPHYRYAPDGLNRRDSVLTDVSRAIARREEKMAHRWLASRVP
jgi:hypothetical protein